VLSCFNSHISPCNLAWTRSFWSALHIMDQRLARARISVISRFISSPYSKDPHGLDAAVDIIANDF
jgi:hypothetical protein